MRRFLTSASLVATVLTLAACNSSSSNSGPVGPCTLPSPFQVIYPIPSATGRTGPSGATGLRNEYLGIAFGLERVSQQREFAERRRSDDRGGSTDYAGSGACRRRRRRRSRILSYWSISVAEHLRVGQHDLVWMNNLNSHVQSQRTGEFLYRSVRQDRCGRRFRLRPRGRIP